MNYNDYYPLFQETWGKAPFFAVAVEGKDPDGKVIFGITYEVRSREAAIRYVKSNIKAQIDDYEGDSAGVWYDKTIIFRVVPNGSMTEIASFSRENFIDLINK